MKVIGVTGWSGSGKTTLLEKVIPFITRRGLTVSVIKHAFHGFDIDRPGKDSYRLREAGCNKVLLTSGERWALMHELRGQATPALPEQIRLLSPCDLVLIEGFKTHDHPQVEVLRPSLKHPPLFPSHRHIIAVAADEKVDTDLPCFHLDDAAAIADFMVKRAQDFTMP